MQGATGTVLPPLTVGRFGCFSNRVACLTPGTQANDLEHARRLGATECSFGVPWTAMLADYQGAHIGGYLRAAGKRRRHCP